MPKNQLFELMAEFSSARSHCNCYIDQWGAADMEKKKKEVVFFLFFFWRLSWNHPTSPGKGHSNLLVFLFSLP